ncbi:uncharacterized protein LOC141667625 [Apium graveolens]|uniref:uncharacterized protein LOC141667625 n=1 Tax=Apium graveolens TaxID=4045 RepID=UPI003D7A5245
MDSLLVNSSLSFNFSNPKLNSCSLPFFNLKKRKVSSVSCNLNSNSQRPISQWTNYIKPFSAIVPLLQKIKSFAKSSSMSRCGSVLEAYSDSDTVLQNGGLGIALLSITANAKVKISPFVATLAANPAFVSGFFAWLIAQSMKLFLHFLFERKWDLRILCSSGGMPSSHSALCTALTASVAICHGVADSLFPVCLGFSLIVMYDAIGVRRHAGMQAQVLNLIVEDLFQGHPISQRKLKELLGHTPSQVFAGAILGIIVACIFCQGHMVAK